MTRLDKALLFAAALLLILIAERPAYAYIDPGTGSLIYQTVLTMVLGLGFMIRRSRAGIARFFKRLGGRGAGSDDAHERS